MEKFLFAHLKWTLNWILTWLVVVAVGVCVRTKSINVSEFFFSGNFPPNEKTTSNQIFLKFFFKIWFNWCVKPRRKTTNGWMNPKTEMMHAARKKIDYEIQFICHQRQKMNFSSLNKFIFSWNESKYEEKRNWKKLPLCFQRIFTYKKKVSIFFRCCCCQFDPIPVCVCVCVEIRSN